MTVGTGSSIAHYRLSAKLGEGGMGQVYRATDTRLHRDVALKLLPDDFAADPERLERFRREARALAALSHPNIGAIHGIEESDGQVALVLELIEGPTLADRIEQGPLPLDAALPIARQIAAALEAAHERGIVHRDLKPANIKITPEGQVKVLDFGLAKSVERAGRSSGVTHSPTLMMTAATPGLIMGTAAYMSPEQAKGQPVDRRADIWAYGAVLFEMLSGRRLFDGNDLTEVLAAVISTEPDLTRLPRSVPSWLRDLTGRCLRRDATMRLPDAGAARIAIMEGAATAGEPAAPAPRPGWALAAVALLAGLLLGAFAMTRFGEAPPARTALPLYSELVFDPLPLPGATPAFSPDGRRIAYTGSDAMRGMMTYVRDLATGITEAIPGSEHSNNAIFSPDGGSLAFFAGGRLWVATIGGGLPRSAVPASGSPEGAVWMPDGTVIFSTSGYMLLQRVAASGGAASPVPAQLDGVEGLRVASPERLPDPEHLLVAFTHASSNGPRVGVLSLRTGALTDLTPGGDPRFVAPETLLVTRRRELVALTFDPVTHTVSGAERPADPGVGLVTAGRSVGDRVVAGTLASGLAAFPAGAPADPELVWVGRDGTEAATGFAFEQARHLTTGANGAMGAALSPDGLQVAMVAQGGPTVVDLNDTTRRRVLPTVGTAMAYPYWDPSGENVAVLGNGAGTFNGYLIPVSGTAQPRQISTIPQSIPLSFSPDGKSVLGYVVTPDAGRDLWVFGLDGNDTPLLQTPANERAPSFSPDGGAIAYISDESGEDRVYVRLHPDVGRAWVVSGNGATAPRWSRDGREIYFLQDTELMATSLDLSDGVRVGTPERLFNAAAYEQDPFGIPMYDVADDGRFLMVRRGVGVATWRFIQNWGAALAAPVATR